MNTDTTFDPDHEDKPDLHWGAFAGRFALAVVALVAGALASHLATSGAHIAIVAGLAAASALIMIAVIMPRRSDDEFDRSISMKAGTFAGIATVTFLVLEQVLFHLRGGSVIPLMALPGFYLTQWLFMSQYLRWTFSREAS
ncbi:MAG: hypothetical protein AAGI03_08775 [Pseudomonadota bacterium]